MSLAALIRGKQNIAVTSPANANPAKVAKVAMIQPAVIRSGLAGLATLAIADTDTGETTLDLFRWFVLEADKIYRSSPRSPDSWNLHRVHHNAAVACCRDGDLAAARMELHKALIALQGVTLTQPNLI